LFGVTATELLLTPVVLKQAYFYGTLVREVEYGFAHSLRAGKLTKGCQWRKK
jgi:hypothetical protein